MRQCLIILHLLRRSILIDSCFTTRDIVFPLIVAQFVYQRSLLSLADIVLCHLTSSLWPSTLSSHWQQKGFCGKL